MTCKYILRGIQFDSEEQLNDFLLSVEGNHLTLNDVVFQRNGNGHTLTQKQMTYWDKLREAEQTYKELQKQGIQLRTIQDTEQVEPEDLDDIGRLKYPFISTTDLIHSLRGRDPDTFAFPIFISDNLWKENFERYKNGIFDSYEIKFLETMNLVHKGADGKYAPIKDQETLEKIRDLFEGELKNQVRKGGMWKQQSVAGNLVHECFSRFYRDRLRDKDGNYSGPYLYELKSEDAVFDYFKSIINPEYKPYVDDNVLRSIVKQCLQFDQELRAEYGEHCFIRTEQKIISDLKYKLDENTDITKVIGKIDLLVIGDIDHDGKVGIIDFKCSPKDYTTTNAQNDPNLYNSAKILTFKYQLAVYRRILQAMGINPQTGIDLYIVPLKFEDFSIDKKTKKIKFSRISSLADKEYGYGKMMQKLSNSEPGREKTNIESNLNQVFPSRNELYIKTDNEATNIIENTKKVTKEWLSKVDTNKSAEDYANEIKKGGGIQFDEQTGKYYFKPNKDNDNGMITKSANSKEEATAKIIEDLKIRDGYNASYVENTTSDIRTSFINYYKGDSTQNPIDSIQSQAHSSSSSRRDNSYLTHRFQKYTNTEIWEPYPKEDDRLNAILDQMGILLFRNKTTKLIDVVRISNEYNPSKRVKLKGNEYILGNFMPDFISHNSTDSLTMISSAGNMELIETMIVLNQLGEIFRDDFSGVGSVRLICPKQQVGHEVPNHQLLYTFSRLCEQTPDLIQNNFVTSSNSGGIIKMATYLDILKQDFKEVLNKHNKEGLSLIKADAVQSISKFDFQDKTNEEIREDLITLDNNLIKEYPDVIQNIQNRVDETPQYQLHKDILYAIAELSGVKMLQQIDEHKKWDFNLTKKGLGLGGTMTDNPGTLQSAILNQATNQVTIAYQNTRDSVVKFDQILREKVKKLKEKKGFSWITQNFTGNQVKDLYYRMYDHKSSDVKFLNPWDYSNDLDDDEREFLKYALIKINSTRENGLNLEVLLKNPDLMGERINNDTTGKYLQAPLMKGDFASEVAMRDGLFNFIRNRFKYLSLWKSSTRTALKERIDKALTGFLSTEQESNLRQAAQWTAINTISNLDTNETAREKALRHGKEYFEHNLETILLKQHAAYTMAEQLNKVFPIIQSLLIHLNAQGCILNTSFMNDVQYMLDYIKTKIHNQPMEDRTTQEATLRDIVNEGMKWASRLALAYNPRQTYQFLDGIWQDIKLTIKYPEFTKEDLFWAWKTTMGDLFTKFGDKRSITELLNIQYGINDMDMNTFIEKIKSDNTGIFTHFWDTGFRFSSRPDYYNRMTIFLAQMKNDGSYKAHSMKDGKLVYDWTQDERFKAFAENSSDKQAYNKAKTAYITLARQLMEEGALNEDGTLFKMDLAHPKRIPLPKAYSNRESEGKKALSDRIYGYYAHEKKSMFNSTFVGALVMQMNTYWSAKKNQWIQQTSYTQEGHWEDYEEDGHKWFWKLDENGQLIPVKDEDTGLPIQVWKGNPQEGIVITMAKILSAFKGTSEYTDEKGLKGVKELLYSEKIDPDMRRLYLANIGQLWYDMLMMLLLGVFASTLLQNGSKEYAKEHPNDNFGNALSNTALMVGTGIIQSSATDFNPITSIGGRGVQWTPFAITSMQNVFNQYKNFLGGNQDFYDAIVKTASATRSTTPMWEYVKLNTIGTKIGEKPKE